jgi:hypothetical protein
MELSMSSDLEKLKARIKKAGDEGKLQNHDISLGSKYINFFLTYECPQGEILDSMILRITKEIEEFEKNLQKSKQKLREKKKRTRDANRRFKSAIRIIILNLLQVSEIKTEEVYLAISKDANTYILKQRYSPNDMTYDPFINAYDGLAGLNYLTVVYKASSTKQKVKDHARALKRAINYFRNIRN